MFLCQFVYADYRLFQTTNTPLTIAIFFKLLSTSYNWQTLANNDLISLIADFKSILRRNQYLYDYTANVYTNSHFYGRKQTGDVSLALDVFYEIPLLWISFDSRSLEMYEI